MGGVHPGVAFRRRSVGVLALALGAAAAPADAADEPGAPRAEVQVSVCSPPDAVVRSLGLRPDASAPQAVWFFDTPAHDLEQRGVRLRLRRTAEGGDLTVKLGAQDCSQMAAADAVPRSAKCEVDVRAGSRDGALSLRREVTAGEVAALGAAAPASGPGLAAALHASLDAQQHAALRAAFGPAWRAPASMRRIGPASITAYRAPGRKFAVEFWQLPNGEVAGEASRKVDEPRAGATLSQMQAALRHAGVALCEEQVSQSARLLRSPP